MDSVIEAATAQIMVGLGSLRAVLRAIGPQHELPENIEGELNKLRKASAAIPRVDSVPVRFAARDVTLQIARLQQAKAASAAPALVSGTAVTGVTFPDPANATDLQEALAAFAPAQGEAAEEQQAAVRKQMEAMREKLQSTFTPLDEKRVRAEPFSAPEILDSGTTTAVDYTPMRLLCGGDRN